MMAAATTAAAIDIEGFSRQQHQATGDRAEPQGRGGNSVGNSVWGKQAGKRAGAYRCSVY
jgi:hypothetical protein